MIHHRKSSPKSSPKIVANRHRKSSPKIITESKRLSPCPANITVGIGITFCLPLDIFKLFLISCLSPTLTFFDMALQGRDQFLPLAPYFCMITLDSALSLSGLRLAKQEQNDQFTVRTCGNVIGCPVYMSILYALSGKDKTVSPMHCLESFHMQHRHAGIYQ